MRHDVISRRRMLHVALAWLWFASLTALMPDAAGQSRTVPPGTQGLDLILLVDVSGSMYFKDPKKPTEGDGNDPERLRWDAVKVALDLLTEEDRIAILPFNQECPARSDARSFTNDADRAYVPGKLEPGLQFLTPDYRDTLGDRILGFAEIPDPPNPSQPQRVGDAWELNGAQGGTALLRALAAARDIVRTQRVEGRGLSVFLLTDGEEWKDSPDYPLFFDQSNQPVDGWFRDSRFEYFALNGVPISTLALGEGAEARVALARMASATGANFVAVRGSDELLEAFRRHVWSRKGIWQKSFVVAEQGQDLQTLIADAEGITRLSAPASVSSGLLSGIRDVGAILYERDVRPTGGSKRTSHRPRNAPDPLGIGDLAALHRRGESKSHAYHHLRGTSLGSSNVGDVFRAQSSLELAFPLSRAERPLIVHFGKRTIPEPLFTLHVRKNWYFRHEPIDVAVQLHTPAGRQPDFTLDDFDVFAELHPVGESPGAAIPRCQLEKRPEPGTAFLWRTDPSFTAARLRSTGGDLDYYNLKVVVVGRNGTGDRQHALSGYDFTLPIRTIEVQNAVPLRDPPPSIALTRLQAYRAVPIEPLDNITLPAELSLTLEAVSQRPAIDGRPLAEKHLLLTWEPAPSKPDQPTLTAGSLKLNLALPKTLADYPPEGNYGLGRITLRSRLEPNALGQRLRIVSQRDAGTPAGLNNYEMPYQLLINRIGIRFDDESMLNLSVGPGAASASCVSQLLAVKGPGEKEPTTGDLGKLAVRLTPSETGPAGQVKFSSDELWLEPVNADSQLRTQSIELPGLGARFRLHFAPSPERHELVRQLLGVHHYQLTAGGNGYGETTAQVRLEVKPPQLEIQATPLVRHTFRGNPVAEFALNTRLNWLPNAKWTYVLEPGPGREMVLQQRPTAEAAAAKGAPVASIPLDDNIAPQLELTSVYRDQANPPPDDSWTTLYPHLRLAESKPANLPAGEYVGRLKFEDQSQEVQTIELHLTLDGMRYAAPIVPGQHSAGLDPDSPWLRPRPATENRLVVVQPLDQEVEYTFRVENELPNRMMFDDEKLVVRPVSRNDGLPPGLLRSTDPQRFDAQSAPTVAEIREEQQGRSALVTLKLGRVVNAFAEVPYTTQFEILYADSQSQVDLGRQELTLEVIYLDPRRLIRSERTSGSAASPPAADVP